MIPRFGLPPRPGRRYPLRPGAYAILAREGRLLLTFQAEPVPELQLPGGGIDPGESPIAALHREVIEETGWSVGRLRRLGAYRRIAVMPETGITTEKLCSVWIGRPVLCHGPAREPAHSACWRDPAAALAELTDPGARTWLAHALRLGLVGS